METNLINEQIRAYAEREADLNGLEPGEEREIFVDFMLALGELAEKKRKAKNAAHD